LTLKHKLNFINKELTKIKETNLHRQLQYGKSQGSHITIKDKKLINLCSNDYLEFQLQKFKQINFNQVQDLFQEMMNHIKN